MTALTLLQGATDLDKSSRRTVVISSALAWHERWAFSRLQGKNARCTASAFASWVQVRCQEIPIVILFMPKDGACQIHSLLHDHGLPMHDPAPEAGDSSCRQLFDLGVGQSKQMEIGLKRGLVDKPRSSKVYAKINAQLRKTYPVERIRIGAVHQGDPFVHAYVSRAGSLVAVCEYRLAGSEMDPQFQDCAGISERRLDSETAVRIFNSNVAEWHRP